MVRRRPPRRTGRCPIAPVDFFDAKGVIDALVGASEAEVEYRPAAHPFLVAGRAAEAYVTVHGATRLLGIVGQLTPAVADARGFPASEPIYAGEIDLAAIALRSGTETFRAASLPRFPSIVRDISMLVDEALPAAAVRGTIRSGAPATLVSIAEFDRYQGKGVPDGKVSLSVRLTFRAADRTLTDEDAQAATDAIVAALKAAHGAERR